MGLLDGKRLLITGVITDASIAFSIARLAQQEGATVVLTGFGRMSLVERVARKLPDPPPVVELDVANQEHLDSLADRVARARRRPRRRRARHRLRARVLPRRRLPRRAVGGRRHRGAGVGVLAEVAGRGARCRCSARPAARSLGLTFDATRRLARLRLDGRGQGRPGVGVALPRPRARAAPHPGQPDLRRPAAHDGGEEHPRASRSSRTRGTSRAPLGWDNTDIEPVARTLASRCCRTGSRRPPARSCTSTAASTPWASDGADATTRCCCCPSAARRARTTCCRSCATSPAGRGIPDERLAEVAEHYQHFGGVSPINEQNRALIDGAARASSPRTASTCRSTGATATGSRTSPTPCGEMRDDGVRRALVFATSATASYSACRQYREDLARRAPVAGDGAPELVKLRHFFDHPGFIAAQRRRRARGAGRAAGGGARHARLVFTAHSIPAAMNDASGPRRDGLYAAQQRETARLVAEAVRGPGRRVRPRVAVAFGAAAGAVARAGRQRPPARRWPRAACERWSSRRPASSPTTSRCCWDLDNEARETAASLGMAFARAATAGTHPAFVAAVRELVEERLRRRRAARAGHARAVRHRLPGRLLPGADAAGRRDPTTGRSRAVRVSQPRRPGLRQGVVGDDPGAAHCDAPAAAARRRAGAHRAGRRHRPRVGPREIEHGGSRSACASRATARGGKPGRQIDPLAGPAGLVQRVASSAHRLAHLRPRPGRAAESRIAVGQLVLRVGAADW